MTVTQLIDELLAVKDPDDVEVFLGSSIGESCSGLEIEDLAVFLDFDD